MWTWSCLISYLIGALSTNSTFCLLKEINWKSIANPADFVLVFAMVDNLAFELIDQTFECGPIKLGFNYQLGSSSMAKQDSVYGDESQHDSATLT